MNFVLKEEQRKKGFQEYKDQYLAAINPEKTEGASGCLAMVESMR